MEFWILWGSAGYIGAVWLYKKGYGTTLNGCAALAGGIPFLFPLVLGGVLLIAAALLPDRKAGVSIGRIGTDINMTNPRNINLITDSNLRDVVQTIDAAPDIDYRSKNELRHLVEQLSHELEKIQHQHARAANAVNQTLKELLKEAAEERPDMTMIEIRSEALILSTQNIVPIIPDALPIAREIVNKLR